MEKVNWNRAAGVLINSVHVSSLEYPSKQQNVEERRTLQRRRIPVSEPISDSIPKDEKLCEKVDKLLELGMQEGEKVERILKLVQQVVSKQNNLEVFDEDYAAAYGTPGPSVEWKRIVHFKTLLSGSKFDGFLEGPLLQSSAPKWIHKATFGRLNGGSRVPKLKNVSSPSLPTTGYPTTNVSYVPLEVVHLSSNDDENNGDGGQKSFSEEMFTGYISNVKGESSF
ncbi:hypothetical protein L1987_59529 [Smallanthus sonchifolius]|uniref:Uncharacterized protein n=1 Tax=Smallanthus sonchifolius TaxID=185202 RepID=A0ACB9D688_9ASTR|nr:hypothetical protein L1987_59529 [Smallanthus sonchifolius]